MAPVGDYDKEDLNEWAQRTAASPAPGVSLGGLDEPLPGEGEGGEDEEAEGEADEGGDPCEALRAVKDAVERLEAVELHEDADPKLAKELDALRKKAADIGEEAGDLADEVEEDEEKRADEAEDEDEDEDDEGEGEGKPNDEGEDEDEAEPEADEE